MKTVPIILLLLTGALASACSSSATKDPVPGGGTPATTAPPPTDPPADLEPPAEPTVKAPALVGIMKMGGALHVSWTNNEPACDEVELERKTATDPYKVVAKLPGEADNEHDASATEATTYTYRARCKKGSAYSAYSNEKSARPK